MQNNLHLRRPAPSSKDSSPPPHWSWKLLRFACRAYVVLWMTAVGGLVFANVAGVLGMFLAEENKAELVRPWIHVGWSVGVILSFIGAVSGKLKMQWNNPQTSLHRTAGTEDASGDNSSSAHSSRSNPNDTRAELTDRADTPALSSETETQEHEHSLERQASDAPGQRSSVLGAAAFFGLLGGLGGTMLGGSLLVFFFSLAYSPLSPSWSRSVKVEQDTVNRTGMQKTYVSRDSLAWQIVLFPAGLGMAIGAVTGGVGASLGKVTNG